LWRRRPDRYDIGQVLPFTRLEPLASVIAEPLFSASRSPSTARGGRTDRDPGGSATVVEWNPFKIQESSEMAQAAQRTVSYIRMDLGTVEDYAFSREVNRPYVAATPLRVLAHLATIAHGYVGGKVDRYVHSLQTATRAHRAGECEEFVVAALLHDIGDILAPENHADLAADVLRPYVSRYTHWMVKHHGIFQGYYYFDKVGRNRDERERFRGHPAFDMTERFCGEYDQMSFDPAYDTMSQKEFEPMVQRIFSRPAWGEHTKQDWPVAS
jgi:predicted HD phosphohydrolase